MPIPLPHAPPRPPPRRPRCPEPPRPGRLCALCRRGVSNHRDRPPRQRRLRPGGSRGRCVRPPPQRFGGPRSDDRLGAGDDARRRPRERPRAAGDGARLGARRGVGDAPPPARRPRPPDARPRGERGDAFRGHRGGGPRGRLVRRPGGAGQRGRGPHRPVRRAVHVVRADGPVPHGRGRGGRPRGRRRQPRPVRWARLAEHAAHRHHALRRRGPADSARGPHDRGGRDAPAHPGARRAPPHPP